MTFQDYFPIWNKLQTDQQDRIRSNLNFRTVKKGTILHNGDMDCTGLLLVKAGQLRAYILSDEGREITIYRLFDQDTDLWVIPAEVYQDIMEASAPVANYTNELMASRFSEVMWLMEQVMWKSLDKRVAAFLLEEASIEGSSVLKITHEAIANHLGTHREVITRMLRYFQSEGMVRLSRGMVRLLDEDRLRQLQD